MNISNRNRPRTLTALALAGLFAMPVLHAAGCWFSYGKEGYVCKTSKDCKKGLYCRTFVGKGHRRKQCRKWGTRTISSKSGYTKYAVYMSYIFWISLPFVVAFLVIRARMAKKKAGSGAPPPPGAPPPAAGAPPPPAAGAPPPPAAGAPPPPAAGAPPPPAAGNPPPPGDPPPPGSGTA